MKARLGSRLVHPGCIPIAGVRFGAADEGAWVRQAGSKARFCVGPHGAAAKDTCHPHSLGTGQPHNSPQGLQLHEGTSASCFASTQSIPPVQGSCCASMCPDMADSKATRKSGSWIQPVKSLVKCRAGSILLSVLRAQNVAADNEQESSLSLSWTLVQPNQFHQPPLALLFSGNFTGNIRMANLFIHALMHQIEKSCSTTGLICKIQRFCQHATSCERVRTQYTRSLYEQQ